MNKNKNYILVMLLLLTSPLKGQADTVQLIDADIGSSAAYFSQLTGNTYLVELESEVRISAFNENLSNGQDIHAFFLSVLDGVGVQVVDLGNSTFAIRSETNVKPSAHEPQQLQANLVHRLYLEERISEAGIRNLIANIPDISEIQVIEVSQDPSSILLMGQAEAITTLTGIIQSLPPLREASITGSGERPASSRGAGASPPTASPTDNAIVVEVIDLNFADAQEVQENLQPLKNDLMDRGPISITAHMSANQLIISGPRTLVRDILEVITQIDRAPRQVYVDAIIAEVSEETAARLGLQFAINSDSLATSVVTGIMGTNIGALAGDPFLAGAAGGILALGSGSRAIPDIGVMLAALEGDTNNRILATPSLMTTENRESTILVGQNVPFITGQFTNGDSDNARPFQTISREDLGTSLKITPRIGPSGNVVMEIWQEVSRIDQSAPGLSDVVTVKRQISTVVTAETGETIAIGGLRIEQNELTISKVPIFGDIPIIGALFRQEASSVASRNLVVFLRPTIVTTRPQRNTVIEVWQDVLSDRLNDDDADSTFFFDLEPVSSRLPITSLRPVLRPQNERD